LSLPISLKIRAAVPSFGKSPKQVVTIVVGINFEVSLVSLVLPLHSFFSNGCQLDKKAGMKIVLSPSRP
jgi:hypothetical protein